MRLRRPRGQHKTDCAKCGGEKEPIMIGREAYCKKCKAEYLREYRANRSELISKALDFYKQHFAKL